MNLGSGPARHTGCVPVSWFGYLPAFRKPFPLLSSDWKIVKYDFKPQTHTLTHSTPLSLLKGLQNCFWLHISIPQSKLRLASAEFKVWYNNSSMTEADDLTQETLFQLSTNQRRLCIPLAPGFISASVSDTCFRPEVYSWVVGIHPSYTCQQSRGRF